MIYIAVLCNSTESLQNRSTILPLFIGPYAAATVRGFMKALARYQVILLGEQRHIRCEQLAQGCCPNNAAAGVEPVTSRSQVRRPTTTLPSHRVKVCIQYSSSWETQLGATARHLSYGITQCYLPPDTSECAPP